MTEDEAEHTTQERRFPLSLASSGEAVLLLSCSPMLAGCSVAIMAVTNAKLLIGVGLAQRSGYSPLLSFTAMRHAWIDQTPPS